MKIFEYIIIFFVCCFLISFSYAVIETANEIRNDIQSQQNQRLKSLPEECQQFYNDGTDKWKDCMGVGKR